MTAAKATKEPSSELFRTIAEFTYDWETWVDREGVPRWINAAVERVTGYDVATCLALPDYPVSLVHSDEREIVRAVLEDAARGGSGNDVEFRILQRDGHERWVAISWQSVVDARGVAAGYRTSIRDIDERKAMERELQALRRRAESAVIARSELLANVSHELRSPAHCISGFAELLEATSLDETQQRYVSILREQCAGMQRQVDDLLQLAALEAGSLKLEREPIELTSIVRALVEALALRAQAKGLSLSLDVGPEAIWIEGDATRLQQILRNLVDNALKFTEQGSVRVGLRSSAPKGGVQTVHLEVTDTGIGMHLNEALRVLAPFEQADTTTRRRFGGVGLGLAIVQRLVSQMGGKLDVESHVGVGTTIGIRLPLVSLEPRARRSQAPRLTLVTQPTTQRTGLALVVDDSAPARELLSAMLRQCGFESVEAASGVEARKQVAKHAVDIVFLDYQMPGEDGAEVASSLRKLAQTQTTAQSTRIYLLTANLFAHEQLGKLSAVDGVLGKPMSRATLLNLLSSLAHQDTSSAAPPPEAPQAQNAVEPDAFEPARTAESEPSVLDGAVIEDLLALPGRDGKSVLPRLVETTRTTQVEQFHLLFSALASDNHDDAQRSAHTIAGQAAILGARGVALLARNLEDALREGELELSEATPRARALQRAWEHALSELSRLCE